MKFKATAKLVRERRRALSISQQELGNVAGVHLQVISNIERGVSGIPAIRANGFSKGLKIPVKLIVEAATEDYRSSYLYHSKHH